MVQLSANFSSLQSEYDIAQDTIEILKKEIAELTKALKQSVDESTETKLTLSETQDRLTEIKAKSIQLESDLEKAKNECSELTSSLKTQVKQNQFSYVSLISS